MPEVFKAAQIQQYTDDQLHAYRAEQAARAEKLRALAKRYLDEQQAILASGTMAGTGPLKLKRDIADEMSNTALRIVAMVEIELTLRHGA